MSQPSTNPSTPNTKKKKSEHIRVVCRLRPPNDEEIQKKSPVCVKVEDDQTLKIDVKNEVQEFTYDRIFNMNDAQNEVYEDVAAPIIEDLMNGVNSAIIAYGQTGSGKTYTMQGPNFETNLNWFNSETENWGITPRIVSDVFGKAAVDTSYQYQISVSFVEIYNERIRDLLFHKTKQSEIQPKDPDNLTIMELKNKGLWILNATTIPTTDINQVIELLKSGLKRRSVAKTNSNEESSRSHAIFVLSVKKIDTVESVERFSQLYLVDLAGSETVSKSLTSGERLDEAKKINTSLLALRQVIFALTNKQITHIPYRDSKLTRILQNSLGGNTRACLIINCSPCAFNANETLSTLKFGSRTRQITNKPKANKFVSNEELTRMLAAANEEITDKNNTIKQLQYQILQLRHQVSSCFTGKGEEFSLDDAYKRFFHCPLSNDLLSDPVVALDGISYQRHAIVNNFNKQFAKNKGRGLVSPVTGLSIASRHITPNHALKSQFDYIVDRCGKDALVIMCEESSLYIQPKIVLRELIVYIFSFLDAKSLMQSCRVNEEWNELGSNDDFWYALFKQDYPLEFEKLTDYDNLKSKYFDVFKSKRVSVLSSNQSGGLCLVHN
ncbi:kinesin heavy chain [Acrasis kona]|uniref:Kinesin-like protein n=1 Tax=Acrasis kona TaxID=1008807 RepID=A0AAW2ZQ74_9EUKA